MNTVVWNIGRVGDLKSIETGVEAGRWGPAVRCSGQATCNGRDGGESSGRAILEGKSDRALGI